MSEITGSIDQVLAGRYRLVALLGRGGMGCVWRAEHLSLGTPVAIKLVHPSVAARPGMRTRFLREAQAAARLRSVNVVQILDHGVDDGVPYIAMECLEGESLADRLDRERKLGAAATALIMTGVCRALVRAHRMGIVHRDLKPDNIFIARDEAGPTVKVLDFGIAKIIEPLTADPEASTQINNRTETGAMLGTPRYMSPEQARGNKALDGRSDLWSLAVIAFQCLTGKLPFDADVIGALVMQICSDPIPAPSSIAEVPRGFDAWFARATQRDPAARFQTVRELAEALAEILTPGQRWLEAFGDSDPASQDEGKPETPGGAGAPERPTPEADTALNQTGGTLLQTGSTEVVRARRPLLLGAVAAVVVLVAAFGFTVSRAPKQADASGATPPSAYAPLVKTAPSATAAPSAATASAAGAPSSAPPVETRRVHLVILPSDASVEVDGVPARSRDGVVELVGKLGSVRRVRVFKGKAETEGDVSITESGALPPKMDLAAAKAKGPPKPVRVNDFDE